MPLKTHKISFNYSELQNTLPSASWPMFNSLMRDAPNLGNKASEASNKFQSMNDEHVSREYLQSFLVGMGDGLKELTSPERPELVPDFLLKAVSEVPLTQSRSIEFQQTEKTIPIFGARVVVDIDSRKKSLVSIEASLSEKPDVSPIASISPGEAFQKLIDYSNGALRQVQLNEPPELCYFPDAKSNEWRLSFSFKKVPFVPSGLMDDSSDDHAFCIGESPRHDSPFYDYFVDAHSGEVFYYFSSAPRLDIPVACDGLDDESNARTFYGLNNGPSYLLEDPLRSIKTYDFGLQDLNNPSSSFPSSSVTHSVPQFGAVNKPAISAHYNATLVFDFFNGELKRNGIDDKGMVLESVVNVYYSPRNPDPAPQWRNAVWYNKKMWYGQAKDTSGQQISYARYLDVIGHELTHGVTETTSNLVYRDLSGALNESFSDIFGILIKNWFPSRPNPLSGWDWEMGKGLGAGGMAIRSLSNPAACGQPDHFSQYVPISADNGGVHKYSGIHNFAAYKVLTSKDSAGDYIFSPTEVAILYYLTLTRLTRMSDFSDCRRTLLNVAGVYYAGRSSEVAKKQNAIKSAYSAVGIM